MKKLMIAALLLAVATAHAHELTDKQAAALIKWAQDKELAIYKKACDRGDPAGCRMFWAMLEMYRAMQKDEEARQAKNHKAEDQANDR